jgi:hypothetical protein
MVLMPSTSSAYPQVVWRRFTSFRTLDFCVYAVRGDFGLGSIPGSSTDKMLVRATSSGQFSLPRHLIKICPFKFAVPCGAGGQPDI